MKMKNNKNIIYINGRFLTQDITGVQRYATEVVKQLDKMNSEYNFIILTPNTKLVQELRFENIKIKKIGRFNGHMWEQISLPIYILKNNRKAPLISMCNLAPILNPSYVVIHDISFKTNKEHLDRKFSMWYRFITRLNIKRYKKIFTDSNFSKNEIIQNYNINKEKVIVTYCSAEHINNLKTDNSIIDKLGLTDKEFNFSLGSSSPHKNHKYIIECAKNNQNILFVISGKSNNKVFNDNEKDKVELKNLIYTGYIKDEELKALYQKCKTFIFPSLYEGFGIPPLEALISGCKRIILSDIEVFHEVFENSATYIDTKGKCMIDFSKVNDIENLEKLTKKYTWNNVAKKIIENL